MDQYQPDDLDESEEVIQKHLRAAHDAAFSGDYRNYAKHWRRFRQKLPSGHWLKQHTPESPSEEHMKQMAHGHTSTSALHAESKEKTRKKKIRRAMELAAGVKYPPGSSDPLKQRPPGYFRQWAGELKFGAAHAHHDPHMAAWHKQTRAAFRHDIAKKRKALGLPESVKERAEGILESLELLDESKWKPHPTKPGAKVRYVPDIGVTFTHEKTPTGRHKLTVRYHSGHSGRYHGSEHSFHYKTARGAVREIRRISHNERRGSSIMWGHRKDAGSYWKRSMKKKPKPDYDEKARRISGGFEKWELQHHSGDTERKFHHAPDGGVFEYRKQGKGRHHLAHWPKEAVTHLPGNKVSITGSATHSSDHPTAKSAMEKFHELHSSMKKS